MHRPNFSISLTLVLSVLPAIALAQDLPYPDGYVLWQSYRKDSRAEVYRARADGSEVTRMTSTGGSTPAWSPDGRWISYIDGSGAICLMRPDGSDSHVMLASGWPIGWLHDNSGLLVNESDVFNIYDPETMESTYLLARSEYPQFDGITMQVNAVTHDNRYVLLGSHLFINGYTAANGSFVSEYSAVILDLLHKDKIYYFGSGCWPFTPPQGDLVFHICADCPTHPDIYHMHLADLATRASYAAEVAHADPDWGHEYNPRVSNDNQWISYMASAGCHQGETCDYDIWLHHLGSDPSQRLRVTKEPGLDGYPNLHVGPMWKPSAEPRLLVTPNRLVFFASADALPKSKVIKLKNSGGGTLGAATVTSDVNAAWLDVQASSAAIVVGLKPGAAITRGTQCVNLTIAVAGAVDSPVTIPVKLIADDSFPMPVGLDGGGDQGGSGDAGDMPITINLSDGGATVAGLDADTDCDAPNGIVEPQAGVTGPVDGAAGALDGGGPSKHGDSGCGCDLGGTAAAWPMGLVLVGLALLLLRRRSAKT
jgi:MYXO-CTERM domain-containing protein